MSGQGKPTPLTSYRRPKSSGSILVVGSNVNVFRACDVSREPNCRVACPLLEIQGRSQEQSLESLKTASASYNEAGVERQAPCITGFKESVGDRPLLVPRFCPDDSGTQMELAGLAHLVRKPRCFGGKTKTYKVSGNLLDKEFTHMNESKVNFTNARCKS